ESCSMTVIHAAISMDPLAVARGPLSAALLEAFQRAEPTSVASDLCDTARRALAAADTVSNDDDIQLSLFLLYACAYGSLEWIATQWEWAPDLLRIRSMIEDEFERELRRDVTVPALPAAQSEAIAAELFQLTAPT